MIWKIWDSISPCLSCPAVKEKVARVRALQSWKLIDTTLRFFSYFTEVPLNMRCLIFGRTSQDFDEFLLYDFFIVFYPVFQWSVKRGGERPYFLIQWNHFSLLLWRLEWLRWTVTYSPLPVKITCQCSVVRVTLPHSLKHMFSNIFLPSLTILLALMHL